MNCLESALIFELKTLSRLEARISQQREEKLRVKKDYVELRKSHKLLHKKIAQKLASIEETAGGAAEPEPAPAATAAGNLGGLYDADLDFVSFSVPQSRTYSFSLTWTPTSADYDLHLIDGNGLTLAYATGYTQPEIITHALDANTTYYFTVAAWEGSAGNWSVQIQ